MPQTLRFRSSLGLSTMALVVFTACGRGESKKEPVKLIQPGLAAAPTPLPAAASSGITSTLPRLSIQTSELVTAGTGKHQATVVGDQGLQYAWFIQGGTLEGDTHGASASWSAESPGEVRLYCQGTNAAGKNSVALATVQAEAPPSIERFASMPTVLTAGRPAKLSWSAKEVQRLTLDPGAQDVLEVSGPGYEVKPTETTQYTLTATNAAGASVTKTLDLKVVPPPSIASFLAEGGINYGQAFGVVGTFKDGTAELKFKGTLLASGDTSPIRGQIPGLKTGDSFTLTVTNPAGDSVTRTLSFHSSAPSKAMVKP